MRTNNKTDKSMQTAISEAKCSCQFCSGHISFPANTAGQTVACPHCGLETTLFIPSLPGSPLQTPAPAHRNRRTAARVWGIVGMVMTVAAIETLIQIFDKRQPLLPAIGIGLAVAVGGVGAVVVALALYFLPAIVGRHKRNARAILVLNLLAGWTFVGWVIAMVWACTLDAEKQAKRE